MHSSRYLKRSTTAAAAAIAAGLLAATAVPAGAATPNSREVVANWYQDFLGRNLAAARNDTGSQVWADRLDSGEPRAQVLAEIVRSKEYARTNVTALYRTLLDRAPDPGAGYWLDNVPQGMAVEWVEQNILASREFRAGRSDAALVADLYAYVLDRKPRAGETSYWVGQLRGAYGREDLRLVRAIWYTDEAADARTIAQYQNLLGRTPNAGEVAYWRGSEKASDLATSIAFASTGEYFIYPPVPVQPPAQPGSGASTQTLADGSVFLVDAPSNAFNTAIVAGRLALIGGNCIGLESPGGGETSALAFPHGTRPSKDGRAIVLPDGVQITLGDSITGGGGYFTLDGSSDAFASWPDAPSGCAKATYLAGIYDVKITEGQ